MPRPQIPGISWYKGMNALRVKRDIDKNPEIKTVLGCRIKHFINWAANQRLIYAEDIHDEAETFKAIFMDSKLSYSNLKEWQDIRKHVFERDGYTCHYCGQVGGVLEPDHVIPLVKGGTNNLNNIITSCRKCNRQKKDKTVKEFLAWRVVNA